MPLKNRTGYLYVILAAFWIPVLYRIKFYPNLFKVVLFFPFSVHKGIRYSCDYCEKSFTQSNNLKLHIRNAHEFILNEKGNSE